MSESSAVEMNGGGSSSAPASLGTGGLGSNEPKYTPQNPPSPTPPAPEEEEGRESMDDEEAESAFVAKSQVQQKRASFIPSLHVPKPTVPPPPPPPVDLSALHCASRDRQSKSSATVEFAGGRTVLDFKCKAKSGTLGLMKSATIQLDLDAMVMRKVKSDPNAIPTGISMECIVSTKINGKEVDVQYMTDSSSKEQSGTLLGSNR